jgi:hypothetical protein
VGDSFDNALAETVNGAYKTELINKFGPWDGYKSQSAIEFISSGENVSRLTF